MSIGKTYKIYPAIKDESRLWSNGLYINKKNRIVVAAMEHKPIPDLDYFYGVIIYSGSTMNELGTPCRFKKKEYKPFLDTLIVTTKIRKRKQVF